MAIDSNTAVPHHTMEELDEIFRGYSLDEVRTMLDEQSGDVMYVPRRKLRPWWMRLFSARSKW